MTSPAAAIARRCLSASYARTMSFPVIVGALVAGGFDGYLVDYRANTTTYFLSDGGCVVLENPHASDGVALPFDGAGIAAQIRWAQADPPEYSYAAFSRNVTSLGCAGYIVSFPGRRVVYFGRTAETHVEHFPT